MGSRKTYPEDPYGPGVRYWHTVDANSGIARDGSTPEKVNERELSPLAERCQPRRNNASKSTHPGDAMSPSRNRSEFENCRSDDSRSPRWSKRTRSPVDYPEWPYGMKPPAIDEPLFGSGPPLRVEKVRTDPVITNYCQLCDLYFDSERFYILHFSTNRHAQNSWKQLVWGDTCEE